MLNKKGSLGLVLTALFVLIAISTEILADTRVYLSYSNGRTFRPSYPLTASYISRPTTIYGCPSSASYITVSQSNRRPIHKPYFSISYNSGRRSFNHNPTRFYYNSSINQRHSHRQQLYCGSRW